MSSCERSDLCMRKGLERLRIIAETDNDSA
jgi:hypothetical protein